MGILRTLGWGAACAVPMGVLVDCNLDSYGLGSVGQMACPEVNANVDVLGATFTSDVRANAKIRTFVAASKDLMAVAAQAEAEAADACTRIGVDLGIPPSEMAPRNEAGGRASGACGAVAARMDAVLQQGIRFEAIVTPPRCQANADAHARCSASCQGQLDPGQIVAQCEPGKVAGYCQGRCHGQCEGRCVGSCRGVCMARDAQGNCAGACQGECHGACDATCHAGCDGQWQAPRCEGAVRGPSGDAECDASCNAHADLQASCTPIAVIVRPSQATPIGLKLAASLQANLPQLLHAEWVLGKRVLADADVVVKVGRNLPGVVGHAGARALACVGAAANASVRASMSIRVTVSASASVSGRAGAGT